MIKRDLRIVSHNVADEAELSATDTVLDAEWMQTDVKSEVCRIDDDQGTITAKWDDTVGIDCVALPAWNGSASSEIRVRIFDAKTGGNELWDSDWLWAAPGVQLGHWGFSQPLNVNHFADGATVTAVWVPNIAGKRVEIELKDPNRTFLDISRLVIGTAFSLCGASYGSAVSAADATSTTRAASGDVKIDRKPARRTTVLNLTHIPDAHRHEAVRVIQGGLGRFHFVSGYTDDDDVMLQQELMMYGLLTTVPALAYSSYKTSASQFQIEEW